MSEWGNLHEYFHEYHSACSKSFGATGTYILTSDQEKKDVQEKAHSNSLYAYEI
jgi:hypothetical protein